MQAFMVFYCTTSVRPACIKRRSKSSLGLPTTSCRPVPSSCRNRAPVDAITTQPNPTRFAVPPFLIQEEAMSVLSAVHAVCDARYVAFVIESLLSLTETQEAFPILYIPVPHSPHLPRVAGRPFFIVTCSVSCISRLSLHFTQYPVIVNSFIPQLGCPRKKWRQLCPSIVLNARRAKNVQFCALIIYGPNAC